MSALRKLTSETNGVPCSARPAPGARSKSGQFQKLLSLASSILLGAAVTTASAATALGDPPPPRWARGRILVQPRAGLPDAEFDRILRGHGARSLGRIEPIRVHVVEVPPEVEEAVALALSQNRHVAFAEKDMLASPEATEADDPHYGNQWHLPRIQAPTAWDLSLGDGIVVAVLDTGIDGGHPDLAGKIVPGWNLYDDHGDTSDVYGHGTWVAGVVGAASNNGLGVASVAWNALLMPVRVSRPDGWAYWSTIAGGVTWAADHGADLANISYNGVSGSSTVQSAAQYMRNRGGVVLVAAGNSGGLAAIDESPALLSVSATTRDDQLAGFSSYGAYVDLSAPGESIVTTSRGGGYATVSGTSFSSPAAAGVLALIMVANPALSPSQVEDILFQTADDLGLPGWDPSYGHGRVNAAAAVLAALQTPAPDPQAPSEDTVPPTVTIARPAEGSTVSGTVTLDIQADDDAGVTRLEGYVDGDLKCVTNLNALTCTWNTRKAARGAHTIGARAQDAAGNIGIASIQVNVGAIEKGKIKKVVVVPPNIVNTFWSGRDARPTGGTGIPACPKQGPRVCSMIRGSARKEGS